MSRLNESFGYTNYPKEYIIVDIDQIFRSSKQELDENNIVSRSILIKDRSNAEIDEISNNTVDILLTFYSLEHLYNLENILLSIKIFKGWWINCWLCSL